MEFPAVTDSKLRFLDSQGIVNPQRTPGGYRKFSQADVERLRYALTQQRDHYRRLDLIREELAELDAGRELEPYRLAKLITSNGERIQRAAGERVTQRELVELTGASARFIEEVAEVGLLVSDSRGRYPASAVTVIALAQELSANGLPVRNLRTMRVNAQHIAEYIDQVVSPARARGKRSPIARERATAQAAEIGEVAAKLYNELLRTAVRENSER